MPSSLDRIEAEAEGTATRASAGFEPRFHRGFHPTKLAHREQYHRLRPYLSMEMWIKWGRSPAVPRQREHLVDRGLGEAPVDKELTEVKPSHPKGFSF
jgi:hypothetical protein